MHPDLNQLLLHIPQECCFHLLTKINNIAQIIPATQYKEIPLNLALKSKKNTTIPIVKIEIIIVNILIASIKKLYTIQLF